MATAAQISAVTDIILRVFDADPALFKVSLEAIKVNTDSVTVANQIAAIRAEIQAFVEEHEAQIQVLLGQG